MTTATKLTACTLLIAVALAIALMVTSRAYAQQSCTQVEMIFAEALYTLYMIDGNGNRLIDMRNGNSLSNLQVGSHIVLRGMPSRIGIEIEDMGEDRYDYRTGVIRPGDRGYEDLDDDDYNDAVIFLTSISCPGAVTPPQQQRGAPNPPNTPPPSIQPSPSIQSVSADSITKTAARAVVNIADHDGTDLTVKLRYQQKADTQDWTTDVETIDATSSTSPATKELENLSPGTEYVLQASFDDTFPDDATKEHTFTTEHLPSISSVSVGNIGQTSAEATINIANHDGTELTVKLRYQQKADTQDWTTDVETIDATSSTSPATKDLEGLSPGTEYVLQASFDDTFPDGATKEHTFTTERRPSIQSVSVGNIGQTSARATINIANSDGSTQTAKLQYRTTSPQGQWSLPALEATSTGATAQIDLSGLTADTDYEVQAWLAGDEDDKKTDTFRTLQGSQSGTQKAQSSTRSSTPRVWGVTFDNIAQTSADVTVNIRYAGTSQKTVRLHYRVDGTKKWSTVIANKTSGSSVTISLTGLMAGTTYEVQAWLDSSSPPSGTWIYSFDTLPNDPSISGLSFEDVGQTSAIAKVEIEVVDAEMKRVFLKHSVQGEDDWTLLPFSTITYGSYVSIPLSELKEQTTYEAVVSLSIDFDAMLMNSFTTLPPDPVVSGVSIDDETQTTATANISIANANGSSQTVNLRYRTATPQGEWSDVQDTTSTTDSAEIELSGLDADTEYDVQASLDSTFPDGHTAHTSFKTLRYPSISKLEVKDETQTSANAVITIADPDGSSQTVHLRYRTTTPQGEWSGIQKTTSTTDSAEIGLSGLTPDTEYEAEASLTSDFSVSEADVFRTLPPAPVVSGVSVDDETQTTATANISIANANGSSQTVHLRYRTATPQGEWSDIQKTTSTTASAEIGLSGLIADTEYDVQASLDSSFPDRQTVHTSFRTLRYPSISKLEVRDETQTSASAVITIADPDGSSQAVHVRYRTTTPQGEWSDVQKTTSTTDSAEIGLSGLDADTEYDVQASLDSTFPDEETAHTSFRTLRYPSISKLEVRDETQTTANAVITIADPDGSSQTVHLRYRTTTPQGEWSDVQKTTTSTDSAEIGLSGLTPDTEYEAEASLTSDFSVSETDVFRTLPPDPVVSGVSVDDETQTAATANISIANVNGDSQTVHLRYRTATPQGEWSDTQKTTSTTDSAEIGLSGLVANTEYDVQASLDSSFPDEETAYTSFRTLRTPSISKLEVVDIGRNGATVKAAVADSGGVTHTVYFRHRDKHYDLWKPTRQADSANDVASTRLRGLSSGTEYIAEASLDDSFPADETESVTFTTQRRKEDASDSEGTTGMMTEAQSAHVPPPGISPLVLIFRAVEGGDSPPPQTFQVWNRTHEPMNFTLSSRADWLSQEPNSGTSIGPDDAVPITVSVDSSNLPSGQYVDVIYIKVSASGTAPEQVIVMLEVLPPDYVRQFVPRAEGGVVVLPDGTVKLVVQPLSPPRDVDVELMKVNLQAHGSAPAAHERVVLALETNTYEPDGENPIDVVYAPEAELWLRLQKEDTSVCDEGRARVYSVISGQWHLTEHRCERDESGYAWVVTNVERLGKFVLAFDDSPATATSTPAPAALAAPSGFVTRVATPAARQTSLPAQVPTPVPTLAPTPLPIPDGKPVAASASIPTPTLTPTSAAVATLTEKSAPVVRTSSVEQSSGGFNEIVLAALGVPLVIGAVIVVFLVYRERRRNGSK